MENQMEKTQIPLRMLPHTYKMVIPTDVDEKIQYLLHNIYNIEWSGVLFYTYEGSFEENNLVITCKDILLMDIGGATSTEFDMSPDVVSYMANNPELLDCQIGLIHSHHNFQTFFSTTDTNTLLEEGKDRNNFVSLIVNNAGKYNAAITRRVKYTKLIYENYTYDYFNKGSKTSREDHSEEGEEVQYFFLKVEREANNNIEGLFERVSEIRNRNSKIPTTSSSTKIFSKKTFSPQYTINGPSLFDDYYNNDTLSNPIKSSKSIHYDKKIIRNIVAQIITGCITINDTKLEDFNKINTQSIYKRRFGSVNEEFKAFVDMMVELIIWYTYDSNIEALNIEDEDRNSILAGDILDELDKLKDNEFITVFKDRLSDYE